MKQTGLYYYGMRFYASWICRFISVDPLQHEYLYYTPYQYAGNKPISYIDLDGAEEKLSEYQKNIIDGIEMLKDIEFGFQHSTGMFNKDYWQLSKAGFIELKDGKASEAIENIFENPESYSVDCAQFVQLVNWYSIIKTHKGRYFNRYVRKNNEKVILKNYNATGIITENFYSRSHPNSPWIDEIADRKEQKRIEELAKTDRHQYSNYKPATIEIDVDKILIA